MDTPGTTLSITNTGIPLGDEGKPLFPGVSIIDRSDEMGMGITDLFEDIEMWTHLITKETLSQLWHRIDSAQLNIQTEVPNLPLAHNLIGQLERARPEFMVGKRNYEEAKKQLARRNCA